MDITCVKNDQYKIKGKKGVVEVEVGNKVEITGSTSKVSFVITQPGEYEVEGISVFAYPAGQTIAALVQVEDIKVLVLQEVIVDALIEEMDSVDVVILGTASATSGELVTMVGKIEPSYVIPSGEAVAIASFVKDFEHTSRVADKLSIAKATLSSEVVDVVVLNS